MNDEIRHRVFWWGRMIQLALAASRWSRDPSTKVGAVLSADQQYVLGVGCNDFPAGVPNDDEHWADREFKYRHVIHAEHNAIERADEAGSFRWCEWGEMTMVVSFPSCPGCVSLAASRSISTIVFVPAVRTGRTLAWLNEWEARLAEAQKIAAASGLLLINAAQAIDRMSRGASQLEDLAADVIFFADAY